MKDNLRFVDSDMHVMEPADLFQRYLDPRFHDRVVLSVGSDGKPKRGPIVIDGLPATGDLDMQQYRKPNRKAGAHTTQPLSGSRLQGSNRLDFAIERKYNAEAQCMGMAIEGVDIAVLYPTTGLSLIARNNLDPQLSLALCQAYNNWIHEFSSYSPERLKWVAMLPVHDVHLACRELVRCVRAGGRGIVHPAEPGERPLLAFQLLGSALHRARGVERDVGLPRRHRRALLAHERAVRREPLLPPRHQPLDRDAAGPRRHARRRRVRVSSEAARRLPGGQNSWVPGLLSRIEWDYPQYRDTHAPYLTLTPKEYFRRNCWAAVEGSEPEIEATAGLIGADRMCVSSDYPHFDSNFPNVSNNVLKNCSRETAAQIFMGGAHLYGFTEADFQKADKAAAADKNLGARRAA